MVGRIGIARSCQFLVCVVEFASTLHQATGVSADDGCVGWMSCRHYLRAVDVDDLHLRQVFLAREIIGVVPRR